MGVRNDLIEGFRGSGKRWPRICRGAAALSSIGDREFAGREPMTGDAVDWPGDDLG